MQTRSSLYIPLIAAGWFAEGEDPFLPGARDDESERNISYKWLLAWVDVGWWEGEISQWIPLLRPMLSCIRAATVVVTELLSNFHQPLAPYSLSLSVAGTILVVFNTEPRRRGKHSASFYGLGH